MNSPNSDYGLKAEFPTLLDNTQVSNFRACEEKFHLYSILKQTASGINPHLNAGSAYAAGLEDFRLLYYGALLPEEEALAQALVTTIRRYGSYEPIGSASAQAKTWDRVCAAIISYLQEWPPSEDHLRPAFFNGKVSAEFSFAIPLPISHPDTGEPILYGGVFDSIMRFGASGFSSTADYSSFPLYGYDDKTTYSMGATWASSWIMRGQFLGYYWAARALDIPLEGFIIRGTAIQKTQIKHQEAILYFPPWKVEQWYEALLVTVDRMVSLYKKGKFHKTFADACESYGGCPYRILCDTDRPDKWLTTHFEERTWSPIDLEKF